MIELKDKNSLYYALIERTRSERGSEATDPFGEQPSLARQPNFFLHVPVCLCVLCDLCGENSYMFYRRADISPVRCPACSEPAQALLQAEAFDPLSQHRHVKIDQEADRATRELHVRQDLRSVNRHYQSGGAAVAANGFVQPRSL